GFDFAGRYDQVIPPARIECTGDDGRKTINTLTSDGANTTVTEIFEPETTTPLDIQRSFCQTILDNFKKYAEKENE
nr:polyketide cyclase [Chitinophagaceae bacterium]